jgi:proteasome assembly chaperone (PAC2) family protein
VLEFIFTQKEISKMVDKNVQFIRDLNHYSFAENLKKRAEQDIQGALIGGAVGVLIGIASRQNIYIAGLIGLIAGKLLFTHLK